MWRRWSVLLGRVARGYLAQLLVASNATDARAASAPR